MMIAQAIAWAILIKYGWHPAADGSTVYTSFVWNPCREGVKGEARQQRLPLRDLSDIFS